MHLLHWLMDNTITQLFCPLFQDYLYNSTLSDLTVNGTDYDYMDSDNINTMVSDSITLNSAYLIQTEAWKAESSHFDLAFDPANYIC